MTENERTYWVEAQETFEEALKNKEKNVKANKIFLGACLAVTIVGCNLIGQGQYNGMTEFIRNAGGAATVYQFFSLIESLLGKANLQNMLGNIKLQLGADDIKETGGPTL